jgi:Cof subfamily protein (haloacid dehalogenase superfamily)
MTLFCSDIDGTLLNPERTMSTRTIEAITSVVAAGHSFVLCSSRMPSSMVRLREMYSDIPHPLIAYNGGLVLASDGTAAHDQPIPSGVATLVFEQCDAVDLHASFYCGDDWFVWGDDRWTDREVNNTGVSPNAQVTREYFADGGTKTNPPHKIMLMGEADLINGLEASLSGLREVVTYRSKETYLEIANVESSKGLALEMLAADMGVDIADTVFFGDNLNDLPAFEVAGVSVAVANAVPAVLEAADSVTARHHDDGVASYLEQFLLR